MSEQPTAAAPNGAAQASNGAAPVTPPAAVPAEVAPAPVDAQAKKAFALLAKKERGLALKAHDLAQKQEAMKEREAEYQAQKKAQENAKRDPVTHLKSLYGDDWYDKLTEFKLSGGKVTPELVAASVDERLEAFEKKQEALRKQDEEGQKLRVQQEQEKFYQDFKDSTSAYVKANAEAYELINHFEVHDRVAARIESEFAKTQKLLTPKEAADLVEKDLEERAQKSKKLGKASAAPPPGAAPTADKRNDPPQRRTLSNDMAAPAQGERPPPKTDEERRRRALEAMAEVERRRRPA